MKTLIFILFIIINVFACDLGSLSSKSWSESKIITATPTPDSSTCVEENYRHKSDTELSEMTPSQRLNESVKEQYYHMPSFDEYDFKVLGRFIRLDGIKVMPVLTKYLNDYDLNKASGCEKIRTLVAFMRASDLDNSVIRLRGVKDGQAAIEAMQNFIERMKDVCSKQTECEFRKDLHYANTDLRGLQGTNLTDDSIRDTLWIKYRINISDEELLDFSNFLILRDPSYPAWSEKTGLIKDYSRINEFGSPLQVYLMNEPKRFHDAYLDFKKSKR